MKAIQYIAAAKRLYADPSNDDVEIDNYATPEDIVSAGGDDGAFVQAWVWVTDDEARKEKS